MVTTWPLSEGATAIASEVGGIVYLLVHDAPESATVRLLFTGFSRHPLYSPAHGEKSRESPVPWGEIHAPNLILTVPTAKLREVPDLDSLCASLGRVVQTVVSFTSFFVQRPFRVVFDIEPGDPPGYPLVLPLDLVDDILLNAQSPTLGLLTLLRHIAVVSIREGCLDDITEDAMAYLVAVAVLQSVFSGFEQAMSPFLRNPPLLYRELWLVHTQVNSTLLPLILKELQNPAAQSRASPDDMWIHFVCACSYRSQYNMALVLGRVRALPMSVTAILKELPAPPVRGL
jgi:hypothetical protein